MFVEKNVVLSRQRARIVTCLRCHSGMPWFQCIFGFEGVFVNNRRVFKINDVLVGPGVIAILEPLAAVLMFLKQL